MVTITLVNISYAIFVAVVTLVAVIVHLVLKHHRLTVVRVEGERYEIGYDLGVKSSTGVKVLRHVGAVSGALRQPPSDSVDEVREVEVSASTGVGEDDQSSECCN